VFSGTRFVLTNGITEVEDAKQMARFFRGVDDWPLSSEDAVTLGVDTDRAELADGWCQEFLDEYEDTQSLRAEDLLTQTVQRGGTYRGTPQESISALLITLATANKIALRRDDEYITEPDEIGRAVRNKTNLTDVLIRFESLDGIDPDQIREAVETLIGEEPDGTEPDAWLSELATWVDENSVLVKRVLRGVSRESSAKALRWTNSKPLSSPHSGANLSKQTTLRPTKSHVSPSVSLGQEHSSGRWRIAIPSGSSSASERRRCSGSTPGADITGKMQDIVGGDEVPDADRLRATVNEADAHRRTVVREQYERITGESPADEEPESVVSSLATWLYAHDGSSKETADRVAAVEFDGVTIDDLYELFETAWNGDSFSEEDLVDPTVVQQAKRYKRARDSSKHPVARPRSGRSFGKHRNDSRKNTRTTQSRPM